MPPFLDQRPVVAAHLDVVNFLVNARAGKNALELVLAIYESAATGSVVKLPLKECDTIRFKGRFAN